jgi:hypothetical protein
VNRKNVVYSIVLAAGILGVAAGFLHQVSGMLIGAGAGLVGMSLSNLLMIRMERKNPALTKQAEIERRDERNRMLRDRAKAAAGEVLRWTVISTAYIAILLGAPLWVTLAIVGLFLLYCVVYLCLLNKYQKEY